MRTARIYTTHKLHSNTVVVLESEPSRHLARVLRLGVGDRLTLFATSSPGIQLGYRVRRIPC